ncbi:hypothetical protein Ddye_030535 [Dipteronia dyeriana]|uniref:RRM domain-containing protein n=1 Tax=Dipteronia dyeriana TaxID=168575 RepID=A0AAD9TH42_9ROSI|nr:hypothetical protein Ddye_030535 [Dipteronia dyeriana]
MVMYASGHTKTLNLESPHNINTQGWYWFHLILAQNPTIHKNICETRVLCLSFSLDMGKVSKKSATKVEAAPVVAAPTKSAKKGGKRDAEDAIEKLVSAKKQKSNDGVAQAVTKLKAESKTPKKKKEETSSSEEDSSDSEEEPKAKAVIKKGVSAAKPPAPVESSSEEDDSSSDEEPPKKQPVSAKNGSVAAVAKKSKPASSSDSSDDDSSEDEEPPKKLPVAVKNGSVPTPATKAKPASISDSSEDDSDDDSDEDEDPKSKAPAPAPAPKKVVASAKKDESSDSSDEESDDSSDEDAKKLPAAKIVPAAAPKKKVESSDSSDEETDDSSDDDEAEKKMDIDSGAKSAKKESGSDEEDSDDDDDDESEEDDDSKTPKKIVKDVKMADADLKSGKKAPQTPSTPQAATGSKTLFMGNLPFQIEQSDVEHFFKDVGEIADVRFASDTDGRFKGYGHVEFATAEEAIKALELNGHMLGSRPVKLDLARERGAYTPGNESNSFQKGPRGQSQTIFVRGFDTSASEDEIRSSLEDHFGSCGEITRISIPSDYNTGSIKGMAYMDFKDADSMNKALELSGSELGEYSLQVEEAKPRGDFGSGGGRGGGRSGGRGGGGRFGGRDSGGRFGGRDSGGRFGGSGGGRFGGRDSGGRFGGRGGGRGGGGRGRGTPFKPSMATAGTGKKTTFDD